MSLSEQRTKKAELADNTRLVHVVQSMDKASCNRPVRTKRARGYVLLLPFGRRSITSQLGRSNFCSGVELSDKDSVPRHGRFLGSGVGILLSLGRPTSRVAFPLHSSPFAAVAPGRVRRSRCPLHLPPPDIGHCDSKYANDRVLFSH